MRQGYGNVLRSAAILGLILGQTAAAADIGTDLKDFWERAGGGVNLSRPTAYQGQMGGFVTLGSLYVRTKPRNTGLFNLQLPSVRAGCGGIDIFGGAFSFISKEELIDLAKAIMQNASSYAFELALESLSPAVHEQMVKLRDLVQKDECYEHQLLRDGPASLGFPLGRG